MERRRIGIVIPALNEAGTIGGVVLLASQHGIPIVVDDGSADDTGRQALINGAIVVRHDHNRGYDRALSSGFAKATELECEYVITIDADDQHDPRIIPTFIRELDSGADLVVGIRDRRQRIGEQLFAVVSSILWKIRDPLCGLKAYRTDMYRELGHFDSYESIGTELAIYIAKTGRRIAQLPVLTSARRDSSRFGTRVSANRRIIRALWHGLFSH